MPNDSIVQNFQRRREVIGHPPYINPPKMDEDGGEVTHKGGLASLKVGGGKRPRKEEEEEDEGSAKGKSECIVLHFFGLHAE